jgi:hypothetical protein
LADPLRRQRQSVKPSALHDGMQFAIYGNIANLQNDFPLQDGVFYV